jgi:predicted dehydrogenase
VNAYAGVRAYARFDEMLADGGVAAVAICTPAESHAALGLVALESRRDVFVEKPLALTYRDGQRMTRAAQQHGRILMVGHLMEYHPAVTVLDRLAKSGELGRIEYIYSNRLNLGRFRREENILWSFAPHDISVVLRLVGEDPIEVISTGGAYLQPNVADITITDLLFDNGVRSHIFVSWLHPYKEQRLVVVGSRRMAKFEDSAPNGVKLLLYDKGADWVGNVPIPRQGDGEPVAYPDTEPLRAELQHFIDCIDTRREPLTDGASGLRVLSVLQAAQHSLQMGGSRVPLYQARQVVAAL